ncbi:TonB-dependent receptor domain-containing protein [Dyadobacter crusticola]|uniref:TonB-dependent receptor domain-containing protein n=1 Tax=Dyadobacter crusticola TaxID=292407 RepID=UPI00146F9E3F|nr:TonB-dependent receptor [Dyadobacter crusticola]
MNRWQVILKITSLGFPDTYLTILYKGSAQVDVGNIVLGRSANELNEVLVRAKAPLVRERGDGSIEINIENTPLATSTSVDEILSRSPGVVYDAEGQIGIFGKGAAIIFINGVRISNDQLSTLSPTNVVKIEIISNPGPRYDAQGNAVINVTTKRNAAEDIRAMLKNYYSYSEFAGYDNRTNIDLSYAKEAWSVKGSYGLQLGNDRMILKTTRVRNTPNDLFSSELTTDWRYKHDNFSNYGMGLQYNMKRNSYVSFQYTGAYEKLGGVQLSDNTITDHENALYDSNLAWDELSRDNTFNANYNLDIDSLGSNVFVGGQYASYRHNFDNEIRQSETLAGTEKTQLINNMGEGNIHILSIQADFVKAFKRGASLEAGGKLAFVKNYSLTTFMNIGKNGTPTKDDELSSDFDYTERVPAGYANFRGRIRKDWNYSLGLRAELTNYALLTSFKEGAALNDLYINVFPSASLTARFSENINAYFIYSSRIDRPSYQSLNPFVIYQDRFTSIQGNPNIRPAKVHSFELGATLGSWSMKTGYNYTLNLISGGAFQAENDPRVYILRRANIGKEHAYFSSITKTINTKWWNSINTASISYNNAVDDAGFFSGRAKRPYYYLYSQNRFNVGNWITFYTTTWYQSDKQDGIYLRESQSSVNIALEKKFLKDALSCNLEANDLFHQARAAGEYRLGSTDVVYGRKYNTNYVRIVISYSLGRLKQSGYRNKDVGESEKQRAK